jgi:hypothetical protein
VTLGSTASEMALAQSAPELIYDSVAWFVQPLIIPCQSRFMYASKHMSNAIQNHEITFRKHVSSKFETLLRPFGAATHSSVRLQCNEEHDPERYETPDVVIRVAPTNGKHIYITPSCARPLKTEIKVLYSSKGQTFVQISMVTDQFWFYFNTAYLF